MGNNEELDGTQGAKGPWITRNIKPGDKIKWGLPIARMRGGSPYIIMPYGVRTSNGRQLYNGSVQVYNIKTRRFLAGFWQLLEVL